jgi:hypothetical protein
LLYTAGRAAVAGRGIGLLVDVWVFPLFIERFLAPMSCERLINRTLWPRKSESVLGF